MEEVCITKNEIEELANLTNEINNRIESLELMSNKKFMDSLKRSDKQVKKREFADWDAL